MALLGTDDFKDARIDKIVYKVLELTDRDTQWICVGERLSDQMGMSVISFGEDAFGDDLEELKRKIFLFRITCERWSLCCTVLTCLDLRLGEQNGRCRTKYCNEQR